MKHNTINMRESKKSVTLINLVKGKTNHKKALKYIITISLGKSNSKRHPEAVSLMATLPGYTGDASLSCCVMSIDALLDHWATFQRLFDIASTWVSFTIESNADFTNDPCRKHAIYIALFHLKQTLDRVPKPHNIPTKPVEEWREPVTNPFPEGTDDWTNWEIERWRNSK